MKWKFALSMVLLSAFSGIARAETYVFVHGFSWGADLTKCQDQERCSYWSNLSNFAGDSVRFVGWNTADDWRYNGVSQMKQIIENYCTATSCVVVCHSTGCPITGRYIDLYGKHNIRKVLALASAEGGTELASTGNGLDLLVKMMNVGLDASVGMTIPAIKATWSKLTPDIVRGAYDHNNTEGVPFFHVAGYDGGSYGTAGLLPGQDDGTVAFHSACGYSQVFSATQCSGDYTWVWRKTWYGMKYVTRGVAQWTNHKRVEYCGRDGCDREHNQLRDTQFVDLAKLDNP